MVELIGGVSEGEIMKWLTRFAVVAAGLTPAGACAQEKPLPVVNRCGALPARFLENPASSGRLFIRNGNVWNEISAGFIGPDYIIPDYAGGPVRFIYLAPAMNYPDLQFLSIRTVADVESGQNDDFVNLRKHHDQKGKVLYGRYQNYHRDGKAAGLLSLFHGWSNGSRSDEPTDTRSSWAFQHEAQVARRRVLAVSYRTSADRQTCVPFVLGPNIATPEVESDGEDEILVKRGFTLEITEARTATGRAGRTLTVLSKETRQKL